MVISRERGKQLAVTSGLGKNFQSPKKGRSTSYKTSRTAWKVVNPSGEKQKLLTQMLKLYTNTNTDTVKPVRSAVGIGHPGIGASNCEPTVVDEDREAFEDWEDLEEDTLVPRKVSDTVSNGPGRRTNPDPFDINQNTSWQSLLPTLVEDILNYTSVTVGLPGKIAHSVLGCICSKTDVKCTKKSTSILCLYFDHFKYTVVETCQCSSPAQVLVRNGLFPTAPTQPRMAISIDLLDFYTALFERSCDAVNAMAAALNSFYTRRGFYLLDDKGQKYKEPFRKGLGYASLWLTKLRDIVAQHVDDALHHADQYGQAAQKAQWPTETKDSQNSGILQKEKEEVSMTECARNLRLLCPACFSSDSFGRSLLDGGDFQICTDGNFHHRHLASAGSGIAFHSPRHFIPKKFVDQVGYNIELARCQPKQAYKRRVPDHAVDECENSYHAANGDKKKATIGNERYDDQGYMSLICRHDIPIFFANIDTPGEQQKYAVALILWFFQFIPKHATATVLYDVACVLDRSNQLFRIFPDDITSRVQFITTAMHAYGHQWACQLIYNPRLCHGLGLTDGEGVERVWSRLIKLIPIVRSSSAARRLWLTDRQLSFIASESLDDLGDWIKRRFTGANVRQDKAEAVLSGVEWSADELRKQWDLQKTAQLSSKAYNHIQIPKELDAILTLQGHWDGTENAIQAAAHAFKLSNSAGKHFDMLKSIQESHEQSGNNLESLYGLLSEQGSDPQVDSGASLEFIQALKLAHNLKISIRRRAIGSFFEWDRLDQAVGGRNVALGTKLHQQTRKAISRRQPALMSAIRKYNACCATLERLYNPAYNLPLPQPLPTKLSELRDNSALAEDVWTNPDTKPPLWLKDANVRSAIQSLLKKDRCLEEKIRLKFEAENLCRWFGRELLAVELALSLPSNASILVHLTRHRDHLLQLKSRWVNSVNFIVSASKFDIQETNAQKLAAGLIGGPVMVAEKGYYVHVADLDPELFCKGNTDGEGQDLGSASLFMVSEILSAAEEREETLLPEDTSTIQNVSMIKLVWEKPTGILEDNWQLMNTSVLVPSENLSMTRVLDHLCFYPQDLQRLSQAGKMLNDTCLNGCAALLKYMFDRDPNSKLSSQRCALFSTHDLVRARYKAKDKELWRIMSCSEYWSKDIWILPIHRPQHLHWVLCVIYPRHKTVLLYDSLAGRQSWQHDLKDISNLLTRIIKLANQSGHQINIPLHEWIAQPIVTTPIQSNNYDCGLWVLAWIASALRGFGTCNNQLTEQTMPQWRYFLTALVAGLPLSPTST